MQTKGIFRKKYFEIIFKILHTVKKSNLNASINTVLRKYLNTSTKYWTSIKNNIFSVVI